MDKGKVLPDWRNLIWLENFVLDNEKKKQNKKKQKFPVKDISKIKDITYNNKLRELKISLNWNSIQKLCRHECMYKTDMHTHKLQNYILKCQF